MRVDRGSAQPAAAPATRSAPTRSCRRRATSARSGRSADPEARTGTLDEPPQPQPGARARRDVDALPAGALPADAALSAARRPRRRRLPRLRSMQTVLDNLIHRLEMAEIVVAFTNPPDRLVEYADDEPHARFLAEELVPWLETEFPLVATAGGRGLMGASFGAVGVVRRRPPLPRRVRPPAAAVRLVRVHRHRRAASAARSSTRSWSSSTSSAPTRGRSASACS